MSLAGTRRALILVDLISFTVAVVHLGSQPWSLQEQPHTGSPGAVSTDLIGAPKANTFRSSFKSGKQAASGRGPFPWEVLASWAMRDREIILSSSCF